MKKKLIPKHQKAGKLLINEPVSESTYRTQPQLNINERELLNFIQSNPDVEDWMMREYAVKHSTPPTSNQGVIVEAKEDNIKNNFFRSYNNFRYTHPWAKGLNWAPVVGDVMDGISLLGNVNNGDYLSAGLGLGMLALPNFIQKPLQKYGKLQNIPDEVWDDLYNKAIKNNNLEEVQQLRDLHFKAKAPDTKISEKSFIGSNDNYSELRTRVEDPDVGEMNGIYSTFDNKYANKYGDNIQSFYINAKNPLYTTGRWTGVIDDITANKIKNKGYDVVVNTDFDKSGRILDFLRGGKRTENITFNSNQMKLADAITYDDYGNIIPLSKRDNFNNPDIRYSWLMPTIPLGLMSYKLANEQKEYKQGGTIKFNPFNKFKI